MVNIEGMIRKAAAAAVSDWSHGDPQDLEQSLWVWYLESPATQKRIGDADEFLARRWIYPNITPYCIGCNPCETRPTVLPSAPTAVNETWP